MALCILNKERTVAICKVLLIWVIIRYYIFEARSL